MDRLKEKTTAPYPPVGADGGQSLSQKPNQSIAEGVTEHKPPERDLEEILRQISRVNDPAYLPTVSMNDLYEQVYPGRPPVVDGLLYAGTYLFVGAPKVGKSFLMAQLAYHVSMGLSLWGYEGAPGDSPLSGPGGQPPSLTGAVVPDVWSREYRKPVLCHRS